MCHNLRKTIDGGHLSYYARFKSDLEKIIKNIETILNTDVVPEYDLTLPEYTYA